MGINHLRLSSELIAALYPDSLVEENAPPQVKENVPPQVGENVPLQLKEHAPPQVNENVGNPIPVADKNPSYHFLGENNRSICVLANYPEGDFLPEDQLEFLKKMLAACKLSLNDIALLNIARQAINIADVRLQLHPEILFLWGIEPASAGMKSGMPDYTVTMFDGMSIIPVVSPDLMTGIHPEGIALKQRLWACLKKLFNL